MPDKTPREFAEELASVHTLPGMKGEHLIQMIEITVRQIMVEQDSRSSASLRDKFAQSALQGLLASGMRCAEKNSDKPGHALSGTAYRLADHMMVQRVAPKSLKHSDPCFQKAAHDEPIFVLRAQDKLSDGVVRFWAELAKRNGCNPEKYKAAIETANAMQAWPHRKLPD